METPQFKANLRETTGKGPARRLREEALIPANLYGLKKDPVSLTVDPKELKACMKTPYRMNTVLNLKTDKEETLVMVKEVQSHPIRHNPLHVDFLRVDHDTVLSLNIPVRMEGDCIGVKRGGSLELLRRVIRLEMKVDDIPAEVVIDVSEMDVNDQKRIKDLMIPEGCKPVFKDNYAIVQVVSTRDVDEDEEGEGEGEEGAAAEAPAAEA